jgi:hypothetical protein
MEIWRPIAGSDVYEVSSLGRVKSKNYLGHGTEKVLALNPDPKGYLKVRLFFGQRRKTCKVHRLVAEAFIPNPDNLPQVNHIDGDKTNNCVENLEWSTAHDNISHAYKNGLKENNRRFAKKLGDTAGRAALEKAMEKHLVPIIATNVATGEEIEFDSIKAAVKKLGVRQSGVSGVLAGRQKTCGGFSFRRRGDKNATDT